MVGARAGACERLEAGLAAMGRDPDPAQRDALIDFLFLLARWNRAYNLTAVHDPMEMVPRHLLDSISIAPYLSGDQVLDLGTGAGLPGIPLAVTEPHRRFVLLDSSGKKVRFVRQAVLTLGLNNVVAVQARIDAYRPSGKFATIVARALGAIAMLHDAGARLASRPGRLLAMKGREPGGELAAAQLADAEVVVHPLQVPFLDGERNLIEMRFR